MSVRRQAMSRGLSISIVMPALISELFLREMSADGRDICTTVIIAVGMVRPQSCVNGEAKAAAVYCGHYPFALSAGKRWIRPSFSSNPRKPISPRERII
jgi:hypothetical protein